VLLDIKATVKGENPGPGSKVVFRIEIKNNDSLPAWGLTVWDTLPQGVTYAYDNTSIRPEEVDGMLVWRLPEDRVIKPGEIIIIEFVALLDDFYYGGPIVNRASVEYNDPLYSEGFGTHPPVQSNQAEFPGQPVVAYPNPFNPETAMGGLLKFAFVVPGSIIQIYTISGELVMSINTTMLRAQWDGKNYRGREVSQGIYYFIVKNMYSSQVTRGKLFVIGK